MMTNNKDARHPGVFLKAELQKWNISTQWLADNVGVSQSMISHIIGGKRPISSEMAVKLECTFGIDAEQWALQQMRYDSARVKGEIEKVRKDIEGREPRWIHSEQANAYLDAMKAGATADEARNAGLVVAEAVKKKRGRPMKIDRDMSTPATRRAKAQAAE